MGKKKWRQRLLSLLLAGVVTLGVSPLPRAEAVDAWGAAAQALGVVAAYNSSLKSILALGNDVRAQVQSRQQDEAENGLDPNDNDVRVVNRVMQQLVTQGDYVLKTNSLPFIWAVNDSSEFNASCYPTNYVSINRGLVRGLNLDEDELAAVLGHELTHGIEQHSAHNYAKAVAQYYGMSFLNMDTGATDWNRLNALANYSIAKNITLPTEYDADAGGFELLTSAGFNPGGGAAAMARMGYYLTYETRDFLEYQDPDEAAKQQENFNDHPETDLREQKLAQMLTDYGCGHVTVRDRRDIYLDGQYLMSADWTDATYDNTAENAYYIAGALAKAFHDYDSPEKWQFRQVAGELTCLPETRVNQVLQSFLVRNHCGAALKQLVTSAYAGEAASGARQKLQAAELARKQQRAAALAELVGAEPQVVRKLRENGDVYSDYGMGEQALLQMQRVFLAKNPDDASLNYSIRGRAEAVAGNFPAAIRDSDEAIRRNPEDIYNYLNRADVYHMQGAYPQALQDLARAKELDQDNPYSYLMAAQIYEEQGRKQEALENYRQLHRLRPQAFRRIPDAYLQEISAKDYKQVQKEKAKAKKALEKQLRQEQENEQKKETAGVQSQKSEQQVSPA